MRTDIYGTLGPSCSSAGILAEMLKNGMTGIRLNLSHTSLEDAEPALKELAAAAEQTGIIPKLLIDMQGPELRTGILKSDIELREGQILELIPAGEASERLPVKDGSSAITVPDTVAGIREDGIQLLIDDGKLLLEMTGRSAEGYRTAKVLRGGILKSRKSIAVSGVSIEPPTLTKEDLVNIGKARECGVYGVMQPFVRSREDIVNVRNALNAADAGNIKIFAKIENQAGIENLDDFIETADEIIIARGDLGNSMPLWKLPAVQKMISGKCRAAVKNFMVVTQMLASMENSPVPTRAEVSDIFNAVMDGASSVMVTGETAAGRYPAEAIRYLANTVKEAEKWQKRGQVHNLPNGKNGVRP